MTQPDRVAGRLLSTFTGVPSLGWLHWAGSEGEKSRPDGYDRSRLHPHQLANDAVLTTASWFLPC